MKEQRKKKLVVILLIISCLTSSYMLFNTSDSPFQQLDDLTQADSLIKKELSNFNIGEPQVKITTARVDSNLTRKTYHVRVPPAISKTQLHAELNRAFYNYSIEAPATVTFPEKNVTIHLLWFDTVIRTVKLQTDPALVLNRKQGRILVLFNSKPDDELISKLASLGEPIPMVIKVTNPMHAKELGRQLGDNYNRMFFQLVSEQADDVEKIRGILPSVMMVQFLSGNAQPVSKAGLTSIDASDALILDEKMGRASFFKALGKLKTDPFSPLIIIKGGKETLDWLSEKLPELKKAGVQLVAPSAAN